MRRHGMKSTTALILSLTVSAFCAVAFAGQDDDAKQIAALEQTWSQKFAEKDVDWIVAMHARSAIQLPPNAPAAVGLDAIRKSWQAMADTEGLSLAWKSTSVHLSDDGSMAYDIGRGTQTSPDGKSVAVRYVVIWERVDDQWKVVLEMFSADE